MSDIVERLRWTVVHSDQEQAIAVMEQAASEIASLRAEIERLRAAMQDGD